MKHILCWSFVCFFSVATHASESSETYEKLFYDATYAQTAKMLATSPKYKHLPEEERKKGATVMTDIYLKCHMAAMAIYNQSIQDAAFTVANQGGSYADAKMALNQAIGAEGMAGGEREAAIKASVRQALAVGTECMKE